MNHTYGWDGNAADLTPHIVRDVQSNLRWGKPHLLAEFSIDWRGDNQSDPRNTDLVYRGRNGWLGYGAENKVPMLEECILRIA